MKDAYYFSHDSNAKDDPKCVMLIEQLGLEGYGIFWVLIETLRDQPEYKYPLALIPALARRYNTTTEKMKTVVSQYGLFDVTPEGDFFFSESLCRRMDNVSAFRESQRKKAMKRWNNAPALPRQSHGNADPMPVKESKGKESKVKDIKESTREKAPPAHRTQKFLPPALEDVKAYCTERGKGVDPERWYDHYQSNGWMVGKTKMKDWKAAVRTWERNEYDAGRSANNAGNHGARPGKRAEEVPTYGKVY